MKAKDKLWKNFRARIAREGGLILSQNKGKCPGVLIIEAYVHCMHGPIGCLWWREVGVKSAEILDIYVREGARQCGVATALFRELARHRSQVVTQSGTGYGKAWMRKVGFRPHPEFGFAFTTTKTKP